jgi:hypothetical protein
MTISKLIHHLQSWESILGPNAQVFISTEPPLPIQMLGVTSSGNILLVPCSQVVHSEKE